MTEASSARRTRVGLVIGQLTVGGAEGQLAELVEGLPSNIEPYVYSLAGGEAPLGGRLEQAGAKVRQIGGHGIDRLLRLGRVARSDGVALLHSWLFIANAYAAGARVLSGGVPLITSARNCKVQGRFSQLANAVAFRASAAIVVNSNDVENFIVRHYRAPRERIHVVYNGVDAERFKPGAGSVEPPTIVAVGRLVRQKNHELFLRAAAEVTKAHATCRFVIVGEGPLRGELEAFANRLGLTPRLTFAGERRDVEAILREASMFWLTSRWEGMPNAVLEALASGLPVVACDVGGVREILTSGEHGFVVPSDQAEGFVRHTLELLGDSERRRRVAEAARRRALEFAIPAMVGKLTRLYGEVLGGTL